MSVGFTWLFNLTGHPALSLPAGLTADGLPVGLHLVARQHGDALLLGAARSAEQSIPPLPENPSAVGFAHRSCSI
jgi:Asp-tRNA(Asn)/Glu-tRNA(Gln) amidotransferase A subunit family amidase